MLMDVCEHDCQAPGLPLCFRAMCLLNMQLSVEDMVTSIDEIFCNVFSCVVLQAQSLQREKPITRYMQGHMPHNIQSRLKERVWD